MEPPPKKIWGQILFCYRIAGHSLLATGRPFRSRCGFSGKAPVFGKAGSILDPWGGGLDAAPGPFLRWAISLLRFTKRIDTGQRFSALLDGGFKNEYGSGASRYRHGLAFVGWDGSLSLSRGGRPRRVHDAGRRDYRAQISLAWPVFRIKSAPRAAGKSGK